jgi:cell division protein FtsW
MAEQMAAHEATKAAQPAMPATHPGEQAGPVKRLLVSVQHALGRPRTIPYLVVGATFLLLALGLLMVWSASSIESLQNTGNSWSIVAKQGLFAVVGLAALVVVSRLPLPTLRWLAAPFLVAVIVLLVLVLIPGIGIEVAGQRNWIGLGSTLRIQPSEFAKLALILWSAEMLARRYRRVTDWRDFLVPVVPVAGLLIVLVLAEGDFGNAMILVVILAAVLFVAGAPARLFLYGGVLSVAGVALLAWMAPYRVQRFTSFLNPEADRLDGAWQVTQGMYAFGTGGLLGVGLGGSREKWGTLPAAHTDFIFAVIGEEIGLLGTVGVLIVFSLLIFAILRLVLISRDRFVQLLATGVAAWIMIQVITNVGATLKLLPITGVTLPFLSYGGSSLIPMLMGIGMVLVAVRFAVHGRIAPAPRRGAARGQGRRRRSADAVEPFGSR